MNRLTQESIANMNRYKSIVSKRSQYLKDPEVSYHELISYITSSSNREPFERRLHERTGLCHPPPVYFQRRREGYLKTVNELMDYFSEKYEDYKELVRIYERLEQAKLRDKQEQLKKEAEARQEKLRKKQIEDELSQIDFSKLTKAYTELSQIDFMAKPIYADLLEIEKLAVL